MLDYRMADIESIQLLAFSCHSKIIAMTGYECHTYLSCYKEGSIALIEVHPHMDLEFRGWNVGPNLLGVNSEHD
jgi:hypothetical protein